jgi:hypothetical protein
MYNDFGCNPSFTVEPPLPAAHPIPTASSPWPWANQVGHPPGHFAAKNCGTQGFVLFPLASTSQVTTVSTHIQEVGLVHEPARNLPMKNAWVFFSSGNSPVY